MWLPVVLHPDIVDFLRKVPENTLQERIFNCIQKLREQQFDGGLRVKKLKGIAKRVWEARITGASRLIFTYEKSRHPETGEGQVYIAVQDICLDHDDVSRRARARKIAADTEWLDSEALESIGNLESPTKSARSRTKERKALEAARLEDLAIAADFKDELLSNIPWQILESETQWQQAIIQQDADLPLKLTPEEYQLVKLPGNLLLSGSAGTGKTTVALYRLLQSLQNSPSGKRLYVAYNPLLVSNARDQFKQLVGNSHADIETLFDFKTMRELCLDILENAGQPYLAENEVNFLAFWQLYRAHPKRKQYPTPLVWDEIRSIIKGSQLSADVDLLLKKDYENLGKKRSTVIPQNQRRELYTVAEWYQKKLKQDTRFDEIDLARKVLQIIQKNTTDRYQLIVCDEVQDLTELHLELLQQLCAVNGQFFFAGDLHQMISPSGFRWEDLKLKFYRNNRDIIEKSLYFNFRSVATLVNLANQLLKLRSRLLKLTQADVSYSIQGGGDDNERSATQSEKKNTLYGEPARLIAAPTDSLKVTLNQLNPGDAILVRTDKEKDKLSRDFESSFVFTIEEAKGLEFDTVILVEFFKSSEQLWNKLVRNATVTPKETPQLQLEMNLLYVAITRARRILNIWEQELSQIWNEPELMGCVLPLNAEMVKQHRLEPTAESWRERGLYYMKAEFYRQAIECFEKADDRLGQKKARAKLLVQKREYVNAALLFSEIEDWVTAAGLFEKDKQWQQAAECWAKVYNFDRQQRSEIYALEAAIMWEEAARRWEAIALPEEAKRCWLNSNNEQRKAQIRAAEFEDKKQWLKAAAQYELAELLEKAAECKALEFEKKQQWEKAAEQYDLAGNSQKATECRAKLSGESLNDATAYGDRGNTRLNNGDFQGALADYNEALNINPNLAYIYNNRGVAYHRLEDYPAAIADYDRAIQMLPPNDIRTAKTYGYRGAARSAINDHEGAIADYTQVMRIIPNDLTAYTNRAASRHRLADYSGAIEDYTQVLLLDPTNALAYGNRGAARTAKSDHAGAIADFTKALEINPSLKEVYYRRGKARSAIEDYQGAIDDFNQELQRNPFLVQVYYQRGKAYLALKNYEPALADFNRELQRNPNSADAYNDRGIARSALGDTPGAIDDYNRAIALNPTFAAAYNNRGCGRRDLGETAGSLDDFNYAIEINPNYADAYYNRGVSRTLLDDVKGAIVDWERSVKLKGNNAIAYYNMALGKSKLGNQEEALADYTQALKIKPSFPEAYYNRAIVYYKLEQLDKAIEDFENAALKYTERGDTEGYKHTKAKIKKLQRKLEEANESTSPVVE